MSKLIDFFRDLCDALVHSMCPSEPPPPPPREPSPTAHERSNPMNVKQPGILKDFGGAIAALKAGHRVARAGWNGKGMWLALSCDGSREIPAANFWSPHNRAHAEASGGKATVLPSITMKTATGEILMGWLASQTDMLAEDWVVLGSIPASEIVS